MLNRLESLKDEIEPHEYRTFTISITSLYANIVYWTNRLNHDNRSERTEAQFEINRCNALMLKIGKTFKKIEAQD